MPFIIYSCFSGFVLFNIIFLGGKQLTKSKPSLIVKNLDYSGTLIIQFTGIIATILWIFQEFINYKYDETNVDFGLINREMGVIFWICWIVNILLIFSSQLLWIRNLRNSSVVKVIIILMAITTFGINEIIKLNQMESQDYLPNTWFYFSPTIVFLEFIQQIGIYIIILGLVYFFTFRIGGNNRNERINI